jgi:hypothetical protein
MNKNDEIGSDSKDGFLDNTTKYSLDLTCTYKEFIEWVKQKFPLAILDEYGETLEIRLPSKEYNERVEREFSGIPSMKKIISPIRFEVVSSNPLRLEGTYSWSFDKDKNKFRDFIGLANNYFIRPSLGKQSEPLLMAVTEPELPTSPTLITHNININVGSVDGDIIVGDENKIEH